MICSIILPKTFRFYDSQENNVFFPSYAEIAMFPSYPEISRTQQKIARDVL